MSSDYTVILPQIPGYTIQSVLGEGGFATVYRAKHQELGRTVALKIMKPAYALDADMRERFDREGKDLAVLDQHPNIVTIYNSGVEKDKITGKDVYYISMQCLPAPNLKELIQSEERYQHPLYIIHRVAEALSFAHEKEYVHRDIKPGNILFNSVGGGEAVLSDFGIAKTQNRDEDITELGQPIGTQRYMSPEQARGEVLDGRTDIYSLGMVFYEALTRSFLLDRSPYAEIPRLPESESQYQPLINRMMAKDPNDRYASTAELLDDIEDCIEESNPTIDSVQHSGRPKWILAAVVISALCVSALLASFFLETRIQGKQQQVVSAEDQIRVTESLELAELNELMGRIDSPPGSNAIELYNFVLDIDPRNEQAREALQRLSSR
jgi:serine/threonine protein kinase